MAASVNLYWVILALVAALAAISLIGHVAVRRHQALLWLAGALGAGAVSTVAFGAAGTGAFAFAILAIFDALANYALTRAILQAVGERPRLRRASAFAVVMVGTTVAAILLGVDPFIACLPFQLAGLTFLVTAFAGLNRARHGWPERVMMVGLALYIVSDLVRMPFFPSLLDSGRAFPSAGSAWLNLFLLGSSALFVPLVVGGLIARDVKGHIDQYRDTAQRDGLTGLYTRLAFEHVAAAQPARFGALIVADIDHFKRVNDRFGHPAGDEAIRAFARLCAEASAIAGRIGGEEFAILLPGASIVTAERVAERMRSDYRSTRVAGADGAPLSASFGIAAYGGSESFRETLIKADRALYRAKRQGRDCVVLHGSVAGEQANPILRTG